MPMMDVYVIENIATEEVYVSISRCSRKRWSEHRSALRHNRHPNPLLQAAWNQWGETSFVFWVIDQAPDDRRLYSHERR